MKIIFLILFLQLVQDFEQKHRKKNRNNVIFLILFLQLHFTVIYTLQIKIFKIFHLMIA